MDGVKLLVRAEAAGLRVRAEGDQLVVVGPRRLAELADELLAHKSDVLAALALRCSMCGATDRVVRTYWSDWREGLCPGCVVTAVAVFDRDGWPSVSWDDSTFLVDRP